MKLKAKTKAGYAGINDRSNNTNTLMARYGRHGSTVVLPRVCRVSRFGD